MKGAVMTFKKVGAVLAAGALSLAVLAGCQSGASGSEEDAIRAAIDNNMTMATIDKETLTQSVLGANASMASEETKQAVSSMIDELMNSYKYTVKDIQIDGDKATAQVEVSAKHISEVTADMQSKLIDELQTMENAPTDEAGILDLAMGILDSSLKEAETSTQTYELALTKDANGWQIDPTSQAELTQMFI